MTRLYNEHGVINDLGHRVSDEFHKVVKATITAWLEAGVDVRDLLSVLVGELTTTHATEVLRRAVEKSRSSRATWRVRKEFLHGNLQPRRDGEDL